MNQKSKLYMKRPGIIKNQNALSASNHIETELARSDRS